MNTLNFSNKINSSVLTLSIVNKADAVEIHSLACIPASIHKADLCFLDDPNYKQYV